MIETVLRDGLIRLEVTSRRVRIIEEQVDDDGYVVLLDATLPRLAEIVKRMAAAAAFRGEEERG